MFPASVQGQRLAGVHVQVRRERLTELTGDRRRRNGVRLTVAAVVVLLLRPQEDLKRSISEAALHAEVIGRAGGRR